MSITLVENKDVCRMVFDGSMTYEYARELEDRIIDTMRRRPRFEVDLSGVREIDLCGIHLIGLLKSVGAANVDIVATSPVVEQGFKNLLASRQGANLGRAARRESMVLS